mgnify:CR=1 FL=1|jgi:hypothetical protein
MEVLFLIQELPAVKELLNVKDVSIIGVLLAGIGALIWLIKIKQTEVKDKDDRINQVIDNHLADLKEHGKDMKAVTDKFNDLANDIKEIVRGTK